jgi:broad specificity phosphatase PhoE
MRIVILRHGKVNYPPISIITAASFSTWVKAYNDNGLDPSSKPSKAALRIVSETNVVVCSNLIRSHDSATELNVQQVTYSDQIFNEAGLPTANWPFPPLSVRIWAILFRLLWLAGYSNNSESFTETKERATIATEKLVEFAKSHDSVVFVGHGIINRMLANRLRDAGWTGPKKPSNNYWEYGIYEKSI